MSDLITDKPLPSNIEAEKTIVGTMIIDNDMIGPVVQEIKARRQDDKMFYNPYYRVVYNAIMGLYNKGSTVNPVTISEEMKLMGYDLTAMGGIASIANCTYGMVGLGMKGLSQYIEIVAEKAWRRQLIRDCNNIITDAYEEEVPTTELAKASESKILSHVTSLARVNNLATDRPGFYDLSEIIGPMGQQFEAYSRNEATGVMTGMEELDHMLDGGGLQNKGLYLVAASEKSGKTSLALDWAYYVARNQGLTVPIVTAEMAKVTLAKRLYSAHTGIPYSMFRPGFYGKKFEQAMAELEAFGQIPIKIADNLRTVGQVRKHFTIAVEQGLREGARPVGMGVIDYMQLMELDDNRVTSRVEVVSQVSREMKLLAHELDIPLVVMSSLNRLGLTEGQRPDTFNLRDTGSLAFDAEAVFFLHNSRYVPGKPYVPQEITDIDLIVARQRNGPTGDIPLKFIGPYMQFMTPSQYRQFAGTSDTKAQSTTHEENALDLWNISE